MKCFLLSIALLFYISSISQPVSVDSSFGKNGILQFSPGSIKPGWDERAIFCINLHDGKKLFIIGSKDPTYLFTVSKRNRDGSVDSSYGYFGYSEYFIYQPTAALLQADGKLLISLNSNYPTFSNKIIRLDTTGFPDPSFGNNGLSNIPYLVYNYSIGIQPSGKIVIGGTSDYLNFAAVRMSSAGVPDNSFGNNGIIRETVSGYGQLRKVIVTSDNRLVLAGTKSDDFGGYHIRLFSYNSEGETDTAFNHTGQLFDPTKIWETLSASAAEDGKLLVSVKPNSYDDPTVKFIRINRNGTFDSTFNGLGYVILKTGIDFDSSPVPLLTRLANGKIISVGNSMFPPSYGVLILRWNADGTRDLSFGTNGQFNFPYNVGLIRTENADVDSAGNVICSLTDFNFDPTINNEEVRAISILADGIIDTAFDRDGQVKVEMPFGNLYAQSIIIQNDNRILYDAGFSDISARIGRLKKNGEYDTSFQVTPKPAIPSRLVYKNGKTYTITEYKKDIALYPSINLLKEDGTPNSGFGQDGRVYDEESNSNSIFTVDDNGYIYDLRTKYTTDSMILMVLKYNPNGIRDWQFGDGGVARVAFGQYNFPSLIETDLTGKIIVGGASNGSSPSITWLCRLLPNGKLDFSFGNSGVLVFTGNPLSQSSLRKVKVLQSNDLLAGSINYSNQQSHFYLTKVKSTGAIDSSFGYNGVVKTGSISVITFKNNRFYVVGTSPNSRGDSDLEITAYLANGQVNYEFGIQGQKKISLWPGVTMVDEVFFVRQQLLIAASRNKTNQSSALIKLKFLDYSEYCPMDKIVYTREGYCANIVNDIDPIIGNANFNGIAYHLSGATNKSAKGTASGSIFNAGVTRVQYYLESDSITQCTFTVTVVDTTRPKISNISVDRNILWPADHSYQNIKVNYTVGDNCTLLQTYLQVQSNEPTSSNEAGDLAPDWQILDEHHVRLRKENLLNGNGRTYTIRIMTSDIWGNSRADSVTVTVPKILDAPPNNLTVSITPNPSPGDFAITLQSDDIQTPIHLRLVTDQGFFVIESKNHHSGETIHYGSSLKKGLYFLEARQGQTVKVVPLLRL
ncbi:MAG: hypothetical protein ACKVOW_13710 [Chitinophagaceae bacterium]